MNRRFLKITNYLLSLLLLSLVAISANAQSTPIENGASLAAFNKVVIASKRGARSPRVLQFGDSHTAGQMLTNEYGKRLGARVTADGVVGARAVSLAQKTRDGHVVTNGRRLTVLDRVFRERPDLIVVAYGTNEVTDTNWSVESYRRMLGGILNDLHRASPTSSLLVISPFDRSVRARTGWASVKRLQLIESAQRLAAQDAGAAFWSSYRAMGGKGSMNRWVASRLAQPDHVHLKPAGYRRLGKALAEAIADNSAYQSLLRAMALKFN